MAPGDKAWVAAQVTKTRFAPVEVTVVSLDPIPTARDAHGRQYADPGGLLLLKSERAARAECVKKLQARRAAWLEQCSSATADIDLAIAELGVS